MIDYGRKDRQQLIHPPRHPFLRLLDWLEQIPTWDPDPGMEDLRERTERQIQALRRDA